MSEVRWLIITALCLMVTAAVSSFVYAIASMWIVHSQPDSLADALERLDLMERRYKKLQEGMKRAGTWKSQYDVESPDLKIGGSA